MQRDDDVDWRREEMKVENYLGRYSSSSWVGKVKTNLLWRTTVVFTLRIARRRGEAAELSGDGWDIDLFSQSQRNGIVAGNFGPHTIHRFPPPLLSVSVVVLISISGLRLTGSSRFPTKRRLTVDFSPVWVLFSSSHSRRHSLGGPFIGLWFDCSKVKFAQGTFTEWSSRPRNTVIERSSWDWPAPRGEQRISVILIEWMGIDGMVKEYIYKLRVTICFVLTNFARRWSEEAK